MAAASKDALEPSAKRMKAGAQRGRMTCFGEAMIRYVPDPEGCADPSPFASRWLQSAGGAELNVTVALSRLGWPGEQARWVSVVPKGILGDHFLSLLARAYPDSRGEGSLGLVRREDGDVGIYHVWPDQHKLWYQRHRSAFATLDPAWFDEDFWTKTLEEEAPGGGPHVLQLTGITPQITAHTHTAWWSALLTSATLKARGSRVAVVLDINHRPALGSWEDLWSLVEPHVKTIDVVVLSIGDLAKLEARLKITPPRQHEEQGLDSAAQMDRGLQKRLAEVSGRLAGCGAVALTCKVREASAERGGPPLQLRWSMVCLSDKEVVSSFLTAIKQRPVEEIGGGDSWLSGTIDGLVGSDAAAREAPAWSKETWLRAIQQGDMLATLKQKVVGDFSDIQRRQLDAALKAHLAAPDEEV